MKFFFFVILLSIFVSVNGIKCIRSISGKIVDKNHQCPFTDKLCTSMKSNYGEGFNEKGCASEVSYIENSSFKKCKTKGEITLYGLNANVIGSVKCCDTDLCNFATKNYPPFGICILVFVRVFL